MWFCKDLSLSQSLVCRFISVVLSNNLLLPWNLVQTFLVPRWWIFGDRLTSHLALLAAQNIHLSCLVNDRKLMTEFPLASATLRLMLVCHHSKQVLVCYYANPIHVCTLKCQMFQNKCNSEHSLTGPKCNSVLFSFPARWRSRILFTKSSSQQSMSG